MKIVYDISVLGMGYYYPRARSGVFRVVENVADELVSSKECDLYFCASGSFESFSASLDYLDFNSKIQKATLAFSNNKFVELRKYFYKRICYFSTKINNYSKASKLQIFYLKLLRRLFTYIDKVTNIYPIQLIPWESLSQADIFHSPYYPIPKQVKQDKRLKKILTVYDLIPILFPKYFKFNENHLIKKAVNSLETEDWVLCISQATKNDLCNYLPQLNPEQVVVTHLAASELFYPCTDQEAIAQVKSQYQIPPDVPYVLSLSTLEPRKNIDHTIRCFAQLVEQEKLKDLHLVLVGTKGWDYEPIFEEIGNYQNLQKRIIVTGYVADEDLAPLYSGALVFVYPSFYEGFGLPPLEAMQCGVPVITSNTSSLPEVVGEAGIMVSPTDRETLCQSILNLYNDPSLHQAMSLKSIEQAKLFSWRKTAQGTINAYKSALYS